MAMASSLRRLSSMPWSSASNTWTQTWSAPASKWAFTRPTSRFHITPCHERIYYEKGLGCWRDLGVGLTVDGSGSATVASRALSEPAAHRRGSEYLHPTPLGFDGAYTAAAG